MQMEKEMQTQDGINQMDSENSHKCALSHKEDGNAHFKKKDYHRAILAYTEGLKQKDKDETLNAILYTNRATSNFYLGYKHRAIYDASCALEYKFDHMKAIFRGAMAYFELDSYDDCISWCQKGISINPNDKTITELKKKAEDKKEKEAEYMEIAHKAALSYKKEGDKFSSSTIYHEEALEAYRKGLLQRHEDETLIADIFTNRAILLFKIGEYISALSDAASALKYKNDGKRGNLRAILWGAKACFELAKIDECIKWCQKGLSIDPGERNIMEVKKKAEYEKSLELNPAFGERYDMEDPMSRAYSFQEKGDFYLKRGDYKKTLLAYTEALKENHNNEKLKAKLYGKRADVHELLGNRKEDVEDRKFAEKHQAVYLDIVLSKAKDFLELGDHDKCHYWCCVGITSDGGSIFSDLMSKERNQREFSQKNIAHAVVKLKRYQCQVINCIGSCELEEGVTEYLCDFRGHKNCITKQKKQSCKLSAMRENDKDVPENVNQTKNSTKILVCRSTSCIEFQEFPNEVNDFKCKVCGRNNCIVCRAVHENQTCNEYQDKIKSEKIRNQETNANSPVTNGAVKYNDREDSKDDTEEEVWEDCGSDNLVDDSNDDEKMKSKNDIEETGSLNGCRINVGDESEDKELKNLESDKIDIDENEVNGYDHHEEKGCEDVDEEEEWQDTVSNNDDEAPQSKFSQDAEDCTSASKAEDIDLDDLLDECYALFFSEDYEKCISSCVKGSANGGGEEFFALMQDAYRQQLLEKEKQGEYKPPWKKINPAEHTRTIFQKCRTTNCLGLNEYDEKVHYFKCKVCGHENCLVCRAIHEHQTCKKYKVAMKSKQLTKEGGNKKRKAIEKQNKDVILDALKSRCIQVEYGGEMTTSIEGLERFIRKSFYRHKEGLHLDQNNNLHWPVCFHYPEIKRLEIIEDFEENIRIIDQLSVMFKTPPAWDVEKVYTLESLVVFHEIKGQMYELYVVDQELPLSQVLSHDMFVLYDDCPVFSVISKRSSYYKNNRFPCMRAMKSTDNCILS